MKILLISTSVVPFNTQRYGGIEKLLQDFAEGLRDLGHKVTVAAPQGSIPIPDVELIETVKVPEHQDNDALAFTKYSDRLEEFDVIHDFSHKHITAFHDYYPMINMMWDPIIYRYVKAPYNIMCVSEWQANRFRSTYIQECRSEIDAIVNLEKYRFEPKKGDRFIFISKLGKMKGPHLALQFCKKLEIPLDIVGGLIATDSPEFAQELEKECDGDKYKIHFNATEDEKIALLQKARCLIYPVLQDEAGSLVLPESWACGTPTVTVDRGANLEYHKGHAGAIGYLAKTEEEFLKYMDTIDTINPYTCRRVAEQEFSRKVIISRYMKHYRDAMNGDRW